MYFLPWGRMNKTSCNARYKQLRSGGVSKVEIKKIKRNIQRINATKSWFFEKIKKINKPLAKLTKRMRVESQNNKDTDESNFWLKKIPKKFKIGECKRNEFLDTYYLIKLNQNEISNLNRFITNNKIEAVIKNLSTERAGHLFLGRNNCGVDHPGVN